MLAFAIGLEAIRDVSSHRIALQVGKQTRRQARLGSVRNGRPDHG